MRRSTSEIRRAIAFEEAEAASMRTSSEIRREIRRAIEAAGWTHTWPSAEMRTGGVIDALRWAAGDAGTEYARIMRARKREDVARMRRLDDGFAAIMRARNREDVARMGKKGKV
jgi:hypothetical protein